MPNTVSDDNLLRLQEQLNQVAQCRNTLQKQLRFARIKSFLLFWARKNCLRDVQTLERTLAKAYLKIEFPKRSGLEKTWQKCLSTYSELRNSRMIWQLGPLTKVDREKERTLAQYSFERTLAEKWRREVDYLRSNLAPIPLPKAFGPDIELYPTFLLVRTGRNDVKVMDIRKVDFSFQRTEFLEEETVPKDSQSGSYTWKRVNLSGSPDKRFKQNFPIPRVDYGILSLTSKAGMNERLMFSNGEAFKRFSVSLGDHLREFRGF